MDSFFFPFPVRKAVALKDPLYIYYIKESFKFLLFTLQSVMGRKKTENTIKAKFKNNKMGPMYFQESK